MACTMPMKWLNFQISAAHAKSTTPLITNGSRSGGELRHASMNFLNPSMARIAISRISSPLSTKAELSKKRFPARNASRPGQYALASLPRGDENAA